MLAVLYDVNVRTVNEHLKNIFADSELATPGKPGGTRFTIYLPVHHGAPSEAAVSGGVPAFGGPSSK